MMKFVTGIAIVAVSVVLLVLSAGAGSAPAQSAPPGAKDEAVACERLDELLGPVPAPRKPCRIAAVLRFFGDQYWQILAAGMQSRANALGTDLDVRAAARAVEPFGQLSTAEDMVQRGCDALIAAPMTEENLKPVFEKIKGTGLPIVGIDDAMAGHRVSVDPYRTGVLAAAYFREKLQEGGRIAVIRGLSGAYVVRQRWAGFLDGLGKSGIAVVANVHADWDFQLAMDAAECILRENPELKGFYCMNDVMALGAVEAVKKHRPSERVIVVGTDGIGPAYESIRAGEMAATVDTYPHKTGEVAVEVALRVLAGQNVPHGVYTPQKLISLENVRSSSIR